MAQDLYSHEEDPERSAMAAAMRPAPSAAPGGNWLGGMQDRAIAQGRKQHPGRSAPPLPRPFSPEEAAQVQDRLANFTPPPASGAGSLSDLRNQVVSRGVEGREALANEYAAAARGTTAAGGGITKPVDRPSPGTFAPETPIDQAPKPSIFQSDNRSLGGYLQEAAAAYRPELVKFATEEERKRAAENYIRSLEPELRARGWQGGDIRNEKIQVDGRWMDLYEDVEGKANAQYLDVTDDGTGGGSPAAGVAPGFDNFAGSAVSTLTDPGFFNRLMQGLAGEEGIDRVAMERALFA